MNKFKIRTLEKTDAKEFQRLRLFALQNNSTSFGSSFEEEVKKSLEQFEAFIDPKSERVFWGAFESVFFLRGKGGLILGVQVLPWPCRAFPYLFHF